jgi:hypothetical protein
MGKDNFSLEIDRSKLLAEVNSVAGLLFTQR